MKEKDKLKQDLKQAIMNEISAQKFYGELVLIIVKQQPQERLQAIIKDEKQHETDLRKYYELCFGAVPDLKNISLPETPKVSADLNTTRHLLEFAIDEESKAAKLYGRLAESAKNKSERNLFELLREMELEHKVIFKHELDSLTLGMDWFTIETASPMEE